LIKVLFTGGGGAGNEALWRLLNNRYELHFADADISNISPVIPENRRHQIPFANDIYFISQIGLLCQRFKIDLLVPGVDEELLVLAQKIDMFIPTQLLLPDASYVEMMLDKLTMIWTLQSAELKTPITYLLKDFPFNKMTFPLITKPRQGRGSRGIKIVNCKDDLFYLMDGNSSNMILQQKIEGTEYTVQMIADSQANLKAIVPVKVDIKKGITIRAETDNNSQVIEACKKIHKAIPVKGCYNIQLILTKDGEVYPFEINPRISTTFCMTIAAGIDPIDIFMDGTTPNKNLHFNKIKLQRHWTNYFTECL
jgi:carbamoyl-phosphate synthase large subunit